MRHVIIAVSSAATCTRPALAADVDLAAFGVLQDIKPDIAPNRRARPARLNPGQTYRNVMTYRLFTEERRHGRKT